MRPASIACSIYILASLCAPGCTRLYSMGSGTAGGAALVHVGNASIRTIDGRSAFATALVKVFEVSPGPHRIVLRFERPARTIGLRDVPARKGVGLCAIDFVAEAGGEYWLGAQPVGDDWTMHRWDGKWEGWMSSSDSDAGNVARCASGPVDGELHPTVAAATARQQWNPQPVAPVAPAPEAEGARPKAATAPIAAPVPPAVPVPVAAPVPSAVPVPSAAPKLAVRPSRNQNEWIRLGTWNLNGLGSDEGRRYDAIADVVARNFDVLTLTEITHVAGGSPGFDQLLVALGPKWGGLITDTPRPQRSSGSAEHYAVVYRRSRIHPCPGWQALRYVSDIGEGFAAAGSRFLREPAFACFEADRGAGGQGADFVLAVYRATLADGDADAILAEVGHVDAVLDAMLRAAPGEADLILAGHINLQSAELALATKAVDRARGIGSSLNLLGEVAPGLRDHILVHDASSTNELMGFGAVLDVRDVVGSPREYRRTVSDHLPVMIQFRTAVDDD